MGEMYAGLQRYGGNERKTACRACRKTLISPTSLHEISQMQRYGGNARKRVRSHVFSIAAEMACKSSYRRIDEVRRSRGTPT